MSVKMEDSNGCHVINVFIVKILTSHLSPKGIYINTIVKWMHAISKIHSVQDAIQLMMHSSHAFKHVSVYM